MARETPYKNLEKSMERSEVPTRAASAEVGAFALRLFRELHGLILAQEAGARAGEVEAVHDMRVGIRRLRVALSNFRVCLSREDRQRLKARLEHLANALGGVRDLDVMIEALTAALPLRAAAERPFRCGTTPPTPADRKRLRRESANSSSPINACSTARASRRKPKKPMRPG